MNAFIKHATTSSKAIEALRLVAVTVERLTVYRYHVPDDADDPEELAKARFLTEFRWAGSEAVEIPLD